MVVKFDNILENINNVTNCHFAAYMIYGERRKKLLKMVERRCRPLLTKGDFLGPT